MSSKPVHLRGQGRSCGATTTGPSASNVYVNGIPVSLIGDTCSHGSGALISTQSTVLPNNKLVIRNGDPASPDNWTLIPHPNPSAADGSQNVYCGSSAGAM